jgi:hypothetical protein
MIEQVGYEKGGKAAYESFGRTPAWDSLHPSENTKHEYRNAARAAVEAERPALIDEVLDAVREELQRGQYGFSESYFRWDRVRARLAEPVKVEQPLQKPDTEESSAYCSICHERIEYEEGSGVSNCRHYIRCWAVEQPTPVPGESTQPSYVAYMAMTPAEREACVQKAQVPQHDAILAKMVSDLVLMVADLVLRVDALEEGAGK